MRIKPILPMAFLALGLGTAFAQSPQTRYDLLARKPGGASDFVSGVQSDPARIIPTPTVGVGPTGSGASQDSLCRQFPGYTVSGSSQGYCDFRATSQSTAACECGSYGYYQHYTVSLSGRGAYEEVVWQNCVPCPPPIVPEGGGGIPNCGEGGCGGNGNIAGGN